jgi:hypothetical protein
MKKAIILLFLIPLCLADTFGQWYVKNYNVSDINLLTKAQLEEAFLDTRSKVYGSLFVIGIGGVIFGLEKLLPYNLEDEENPTFLEQLLGSKGMHVVTLGAGIGLAGVGAIACISYLGRLVIIRSALNRNFPLSGSLNLTPAIVFEQYSHSPCPGFTLRYSF